MKPRALLVCLLGISASPSITGFGAVSVGTVAEMPSAVAAADPAEEEVVILSDFCLDCAPQRNWSVTIAGFTVGLVDWGGGHTDLWLGQ